MKNTDESFVSCLDDVKRLSVDEKIRLFNGDGSWKTFSAGGKLPVITMSDGPHGLRKQDAEEYADLNNSKVATCFPTACCVASSWNVESAAALGKAIALEARKEDVQLMLGPGINIKRSPLCGRNFEYFSEDPFLAGTMAASYIGAMQAEGVGTSLKHFAANSQEKRRQTSNSIIDERTLNEIYLRAFEIAVKKASPVSIMASYNRLNGKYVCCHKELLSDILRKRWGFTGFVVSDWGAAIDAPACVKAGMDLAMPDSNLYLDHNLKQALAEGVLAESDVEKANERIVSWAKKLQDGFVKCDVDYARQHKVALDIACDSAVLLKNDGMLPLKKGEVFVAGELAEFMKFQGGGSSHITTAPYANALESLESLGFDVKYSKGYYSGFCTERQTGGKNRPLLKALVKDLKAALAVNADMPVLFFCGLTEKYEGEGFDRADLNLPLEQLAALEEILAVTKNVAVVSFSGSPVAMPFVDRVRGILHMYLCGEACGEAVASLVSGKVCPSGKLAETFPLCAEDTPCFGNFAPDGDNVEYREGVFVGYRHYDSFNKPVLFDFGFGLSYTSFEYSDLKVVRRGGGVKVQLNVKNTGRCGGGEIVQVYVKNPGVGGVGGSAAGTAGAVGDRPLRELRGFTKVFLKKGESRDVEIVLDENAFKVFSVKDHDFVTVNGKYEVQVCASLNDVRLSKTVNVKEKEGVEFGDVCRKVKESYWKSVSIEPHGKGSYTISDSLVDMSSTCLFIRILLKVLTIALQVMNKGKSKEDPAVKIAVSAVCENPLESLISTSGGAITEGFAKFLVRKANR